MSHLDQLNPQQRAAVTFGLLPGEDPCRTPPLLVIAGAGTGKTTTVAHRVVALVLAGVDPRRLLLLTFSRRAAEEMTRRSARLLERAGATIAAKDGLRWAGTFHSIGHRLLRIYAEEIGLERGFSLLDRGDMVDLFDLVRAELGLAELDRRFPRKATCAEIYSRALNTEHRLGEVLRAAYPWCSGFEGELKQLFTAYGEAKRRQAVIDLDDLLLLWERLMRVPELARDVARRFDHVLVDEYQDTNALQGSIVRALRPERSGVTVVGDDAQAIYGFRGATVRNILDFPAGFAPRATVLPLMQNYRSSQPILDLAHAVIGRAREGFGKRLTAERPGGMRPRYVEVSDDLAQVRYVVERILAAREAGVPLDEQAVLFRTAHHSAALELELARRNIPFVKWGGLRFLEAAHVKDVLAVLRWAANPKDRLAPLRVLQFLPGIGPGTARRILGRLHPETAFDDLGRVNPPPAAAEHWPHLARLMGQLARQPCWPDDLAMVRAFYDPLLPELHDDPVARRLDLDQLEGMARRSSDRAAFLAELTLDPPDALAAESGIPDRDEEQLVLSTIHSAKGQEWRSVFILNAVDGCIPSDLATGSEAEIEEERRLLYVALTRAKDELHLLLPQRFYVLQQARAGDRHVRAIRTRFITDDMLPLFERVQEHWNLAGCSDRSSRGLPRVDLASELGSLWK